MAQESKSSEVCKCATKFPKLDEAPGYCGVCGNLHSQLQYLCTHCGFGPQFCYCGSLSDKSPADEPPCPTFTVQYVGQYPDTIMPLGKGCLGVKYANQAFEMVISSGNGDDEEKTLVIVIDVSMSMNSPGVSGKTRMEQTVERLMDLLRVVPAGTRVIVLLFAADVQHHATRVVTEENRQELVDLMAGINTQLSRNPFGTSFEVVRRRLVQLHRNDANMVVMMFTDGEEHSDVKLLKNKLNATLKVGNFILIAMGNTVERAQGNIDHNHLGYLYDGDSIDDTDIACTHVRKKMGLIPISLALSQGGRVAAYGNEKPQWFHPAHNLILFILFEDRASEGHPHTLVFNGKEVDLNGAVVLRGEERARAKQDLFVLRATAYTTVYRGLTLPDKVEKHAEFFRGMVSFVKTTTGSVTRETRQRFAHQLTQILSDAQTASKHQEVAPISRAKRPVDQGYTKESCEAAGKYLKRRRKGN
jgi:hypothetical protein